MAYLVGTLHIDVYQCPSRRKVEYQNPEVLIIDDTLSSLDVDTELSLIENLKNHFSEKILIIVSSSISTIFGFDNISVVDNGTMIEVGDLKT